MTNPDPESVSWLRLILASVVVFGLMAALGFILKYINMRGWGMPGLTAKSQRLQLVEHLVIDAKRRLVIVRCDETEHLLLLGSNQDTVVQTNLSSPRTSNL